MHMLKAASASAAALSLVIICFCIPACRDPSSPWLALWVSARDLCPRKRAAAQRRCSRRNARIQAVGVRYQMPEWKIFCFDCGQHPTPSISMPSDQEAVSFLPVVFLFCFLAFAYSKLDNHCLLLCVADRMMSSCRGRPSRRSLP